MPWPHREPSRPEPSGGTELAILFWFYKEPGLCEDRLRLLRKLNPGMRIFGLFGGDPDTEHTFRERLTPYLDDFYCFAPQATPEWKWRNGDLLLADWHRQRGGGLQWDSIVIVQWDMLVLAPMAELFGSLPRGSIFLSGFRSMEQEPVEGWVWVEGAEERQDYLRFLQHVRTRHSWEGDPTACIFIVVVLSREFLQKYVTISEPELGFIEYRVPIYAQAFGIDVQRDDRFTISAPGGNPGSAVLTVGQPILLSTVIRNLVAPSGARVFHPYRAPFPAAYFVLALAARRVLVAPLVRLIERLRCR